VLRFIDEWLNRCGRELRDSKERQLPYPQAKKRPRSSDLPDRERRSSDPDKWNIAARREDGRPSADDRPDEAAASGAINPAREFS
jgi:hypothetical protein